MATDRIIEPGWLCPDRHVGRRAVLRLGAAMRVARHDRAGEAKAARQLAREVGDDVAVEIGRDDHVETLRVANEVRGRGVDQ